jgi:hypothetical protein
MRPTEFGFTSCPQSVVASFAQVFILLDALDECQVVDRCRTRLLSDVFHLLDTSRIKLFAIFRHIPDITDKFRVAQALEVCATTEDVRKFVEGNIDTLPKYVQRMPELQEQPKTKITEPVDGR